MNRASGGNGLLDEAVQARGGPVGHERQADTADALPVFFGRDGDQRFAHAIAAGPGTDAADESLVDFDCSVEAIPARTHHGPAQLMQPKPSRLVTTQTEHALYA